MQVQFRTLILAGAAAACAGAAQAQVPVIDAATLAQASQTAANTARIMQTNRQMLQVVQQTLAAVSGDRSTGSIASAALGSGFSMGGAPDLGSILGGSQMAWGNLGDFGKVAATVVNGLNLVKSLSGSVNGSLTSTDKAYMGAVNTATALAGMVAGTQSAAGARSTAFRSAGTQIGSAPDVKGSVDQNSQLQVQTGLVVNELIGVMNAGNAAMNASLMQELDAQSKAAKVMAYDADAATLTGK